MGKERFTQGQEVSRDARTGEAIGRYSTGTDGSMATEARTTTAIMRTWLVAKTASLATDLSAKNKLEFPTHNEKRTIYLGEPCAPHFFGG